MNNVRLQRLMFVLGELDEFSGSRRIGDDVLAKLDLKRAGLLGETTEISWEREAQFLRLACQELRDNSFAARAGLAFKGTTNLTAYIAKYSQTLQDAIENSAKYYSIQDPSYTFGLKISGNAATFEIDRLEPGLSRYHRHMELVAFAAIGRMRSVTQTHFFPLEIRFRHPGHDLAAKLPKLAGFPVVFGAERTEVILSRSTLELAIPTYDPSLREHLKQYAARLKHEHTQRTTSNLRARIEGILAANLPGRVVPAEEMAASLGMSRRTFARRLKENKCSFREIVDDLRCDLASSYLRDGFSIAEVSFFLDYGDQAAFSTAFKRWTGQSPSDFRAANLHG